jgi:hypothetical protein
MMSRKTFTRHEKISAMFLCQGELQARRDKKDQHAPGVVLVVGLVLAQSSATQDEDSDGGGEAEHVPGVALEVDDCARQRG